MTSLNLPTSSAHCIILERFNCSSTYRIQRCRDRLRDDWKGVHNDVPVHPLRLFLRNISNGGSKYRSWISIALRPAWRDDCSLHGVTNGNTQSEYICACINNIINLPSIINYRPPIYYNATSTSNGREPG